jgi:hypothetical protein
VVCVVKPVCLSVRPSVSVCLHARVNVSLPPEGRPEVGVTSHSVTALCLKSPLALLKGNSERQAHHLLQGAKQTADCLLSHAHYIPLTEIPELGKTPQL